MEYLADDFTVFDEHAGTIVTHRGSVKACRPAENRTPGRIRFETEYAQQVTAGEGRQLVPRHHFEAKVKRTQGQKGRKKEAEKEEYGRQGRPSE